MFNLNHFIGASLFMIVITINISLITCGTSELNQPCNKTDDCRKDAYVCNKTCMCAAHYRQNDQDLTCVGAIGMKCELDSHCAAGKCENKVCTCTDPKQKPSEDNWSCINLPNITPSSTPNQLPSIPIKQNDTPNTSGPNAAGLTKPFVFTLAASSVLLLLLK